MPESHVTRPAIGVGVLVWRGQRILLGKRISEDKSTCWQFPGGYLEGDESVTDCAAREVLEETGLTVKAFRHLGFTDKTFVIEAGQYITLLVSCEYSTGEARVLEPEKCETWQWFDCQQLPEPLFKPIEIFLSQQDDLYALHKKSLLIKSGDAKREL